MSRLGRLSGWVLRSLCYLDPMANAACFDAGLSDQPAAPEGLDLAH